MNQAEYGQLMVFGWPDQEAFNNGAGLARMGMLAFLHESAQNSAHSVQVRKFYLDLFHSLAGDGSDVFSVSTIA